MLRQQRSLLLLLLLVYSIVWCGGGEAQVILARPTGERTWRLRPAPRVEIGRKAGGKHWWTLAFFFPSSSSSSFLFFPHSSDPLLSTLFSKISNSTLVCFLRARVCVCVEWVGGGVEESPPRNTHWRGQCGVVWLHQNAFE